MSTNLSDGNLHGGSLIVELATNVNICCKYKAQEGYWTLAGQTLSHAHADTQTHNTYTASHKHTTLPQHHTNTQTHNTYTASHKHTNTQHLHSITQTHNTYTASHKHTTLTQHHTNTQHLHSITQTHKHTTLTQHQSERTVNRVTLPSQCSKRFSPFTCGGSHGLKLNCLVLNTSMCKESICYFSIVQNFHLSTELESK